MAAGSRTAKLLIGAMLNHLPPSASTLHLLDVDGACGDIFAAARPDLNITAVTGDPATWHIEPDTFDAVVAYNRAGDGALMAAALAALRTGGRLIIVDAQGDPAADQVSALENTGFTRILVETGIECPLPVGMLMRGEKPHTTADTLARVQVAADLDADLLNWDTFNGRFIYVLVRQSPNKPVWKLTPDDVITWQAAALHTEKEAVMLAFSSLPKAVAFMQPAVLERLIRDVNKVAKFSRETAQTWSTQLALNLLPTALTDHRVTWIALDPQTAETPDE